MKINLPVSQREVAVPASANILSTTDLKGAVSHVNPDFLSISGFSAEELLGHNHNRVRHPDMPPAAFAHLWRTLQAGRSWNPSRPFSERDCVVNRPVPRRWHGEGHGALLGLGGATYPLWARAAPAVTRARWKPGMGWP